MSRTSQAREHLLALYRSDTATPEEIAEAHRAYDDAATAEGVQAVVDSISPRPPNPAITTKQKCTPNPAPADEPAGTGLRSSGDTQLANHHRAASQQSGSNRPRTARSHGRRSPRTGQQPHSNHGSATEGSNRDSHR
jgi:hypothetical protein